LRPALGFVLFGAFVALVAAHVAIAVGLARKGAWARAALALLVPPLAPWWGWSEGMRRRTIAWGTALSVYAITVALA
jgi:hypothetical protein